MQIKAVLYQQCVDYANHRLATIEKTISSHQEALSSETKSSAGDKHETGRAMLQLEMEKAGQQLASIQQMKETLARVDITKSSLIRLGSLVETNLGTYFISISAGQLAVAGNNFFAISVSSPLGQLLLGKKEGDRLLFNEKEIIVNSIK